MAGPRVLFVDDEPAILTAYRRGMRSVAPDWPVLVAGNAFDALGLLAAEPVDVLVTDLRMPRMTGSELAREVLLRYPWVIRIILSGMVDPDSVAIGSQWSERYLTKPCSLADLCHEIRQAMEWREKDRALEPKPGDGETMRPLGLPLVLQVDDNPDDIELLGHAFTTAGARVRHRSLPDAGAALAYLAAPGPTTPRPDVIVLDLQMPQIDGVEFLKRYRQTPGATVPVMVVSGSINPQAQDAARQHGATAFLLKPGNWDQYLEMARVIARHVRLVTKDADSG